MKHRPGRKQLLLLAGLYAALAAVWTWKLAPRAESASQGQAEEKAQQEHQARLSQAAAWLAKAPRHSAMPALLQLMQMPEADVRELAGWIRQPPMSQIRQLTVQASPLASLGREWNEALLYTWLGHHPQVSMQEAHLMVAASGDRLSSETRLDILSAMATEAMLRGESHAAVEILARACELPGTTWEMQKQLAAAGRSARQFPPVLRSLGLWLAREPAPEEQQAARDLELSLMLDADLAAEAFALQMSRLTGKAPFAERDLDRAWVAARQAHQEMRFIPVLEKHLATFPEAAMPVEALKKHTGVSPDYVRWLTCHTAICESLYPASAAYSGYLRLAALRVPAALPRLCGLATGPQAEKEVEALLREALTDAARRQQVLTLAMTPPHCALARQALAAELRARPADRDLHFAATRQTALLKRHTPDPLLWQEFLQRFPGDAEAQAELAQSRQNKKHDARREQKLQVSRTK